MISLSFSKNPFSWNLLRGNVFRVPRAGFSAQNNLLSFPNTVEHIQKDKKLSSSSTHQIQKKKEKRKESNKKIYNFLLDDL